MADSGPAPALQAVVINEDSSVELNENNSGADQADEDHFTQSPYRNTNAVYGGDHKRRSVGQQLPYGSDR